eukprot:ANDGO_08287.mRNA.1 hypothetical protein
MDPSNSRLTEASDRKVRFSGTSDYSAAARVADVSISASDLRRASAYPVSMSPKPEADLRPIDRLPTPGLGSRKPPAPRSPSPGWVEGMDGLGVVNLPSMSRSSTLGLRQSQENLDTSWTNVSQIIRATEDSRKARAKTYDEFVKFIASSSNVGGELSAKDVLTLAAFPVSEHFQGILGLELEALRSLAKVVSVHGGVSAALFLKDLSQQIQELCNTMASIMDNLQSHMNRYMKYSIGKLPSSSARVRHAAPPFSPPAGFGTRSSPPPVHQTVHVHIPEYSFSMFKNANGSDAVQSPSTDSISDTSSPDYFEAAQSGGSYSSKALHGPQSVGGRSASRMHETASYSLQKILSFEELKKIKRSEREQELELRRSFQLAQERWEKDVLELKDQKDLQYLDFKRRLDVERTTCNELRYANRDLSEKLDEAKRCLEQLGTKVIVQKQSCEDESTQTDVMQSENSCSRAYPSLKVLALLYQLLRPTMEARMHLSLPPIRPPAGDKSVQTDERPQNIRVSSDLLIGHVRNVHSVDLHKHDGNMSDRSSSFSSIDESLDGGRHELTSLTSISLTRPSVDASSATFSEFVKHVRARSSFSKDTLPPLKVTRENSETFLHVPEKGNAAAAATPPHRGRQSSNVPLNLSESDSDSDLNSPSHRYHQSTSSLSRLRSNSGSSVGHVSASDSKRHRATPTSSRSYGSDRDPDDVSISAREGYKDRIRDGGSLEGKGSVMSMTSFSAVIAASAVAKKKIAELQLKKAKREDARQKARLLRQLPKNELLERTMQIAPNPSQGISQSHPIRYQPGPSPIRSLGWILEVARDFWKYAENLLLDPQSGDPVFQKYTLDAVLSNSSFQIRKTDGVIERTRKPKEEKTTNSKDSRMLVSDGSSSTGIWNSPMQILSSSRSSSPSTVDHQQSSRTSGDEEVADRTSNSGSTPPTTRSNSAASITSSGSFQNSNINVTPFHIFCLFLEESRATLGDVGECVVWSCVEHATRNTEVEDFSKFIWKQWNMYVLVAFLRVRKLIREELPMSVVNQGSGDAHIFTYFVPLLIRRCVPEGIRMSELLQKCFDTGFKVREGDALWQVTAAAPSFDTSTLSPGSLRHRMILDTETVLRDKSKWVAVRVIDLLHWLAEELYKRTRLLN